MIMLSLSVLKISRQGCSLMRQWNAARKVGIRRYGFGEMMRTWGVCFWISGRYRYRMDGEMELLEEVGLRDENPDSNLSGSE